MSKAKKAVKAPIVTLAPVVTEVASVATKLTKRNNTATDKPLVATEKPQRSRAPHNVAAWDAIKAALPATAAELAKLEPLQDAKCVSPQAFLSYMLRRGYLAVKQD
jgi:hypothetical protein